MSTNPIERSQTVTRQDAKRKARQPRRQRPPELYQIVIECRDEEQQRTFFERLRQAGLKVRLLVL